MSRVAADELGLAPGVSAVAVVKSTNVVVETEGPRPHQTCRRRRTPREARPAGDED